MEYRQGYEGTAMPESLFGAPYLCMHRADLHEALAAVVPEEIIHSTKN